MVPVCTVPSRGGRSCEHFGGYKTINRLPLPLPDLDCINAAAACVQFVSTTGTIVIQQFTTHLVSSHLYLN